MVAAPRRTRKAIFKVYVDLDLYSRRGEYRGKLRVSINPYGRQQRIHIREWYHDEYSTNMIPGRGITFKAEHLDAVLYALAQMRDDITHNRVAYTDVYHPAPPELMHYRHSDDDEYIGDPPEEIE